MYVATIPYVVLIFLKSHLFSDVNQGFKIDRSQFFIWTFSFFLIMNKGIKGN